VSEFDGFDVLNGRIKLPRPMPCINADLTVVAWSRDRGIYEIGRGKDLESAKAIARLHAGHDDFMRFDKPIEVLVTLGAALGDDE